VTRPLFAALLAGLLGGGALGALVGEGPATVAYLSDTEEAHARFTGNVPSAVCAAFWANSTTRHDTLKITGSDHALDACMHSNRQFDLGGGRNTFHRTIRYVEAYKNNSNGHDLRAGIVQVRAEPYPYPFAIEDYQPGGCKAQAAAAQGQYYRHAGNVQIKGGPLREGLHYVEGSATVDLGVFAGGITIVATRSIKIDTGFVTARPYVDGLVAFANGQGPNTLTFGNNGGSLEGVFYAPQGAVSFAGQNLTYAGQVVGDSITLSGSNSFFRAAAPVATPRC